MKSKGKAEDKRGDGSMEKDPKQQKDDFLIVAIGASAGESKHSWIY